MDLNISKRNLWHYVNLKIKRLIHHYHVFSVISILFDEMIKDLLNGKQIKIVNFGVFELKNSSARKYHDVRFHKIMESPGHRVLRLFLSKPIHVKLRNEVNIDKKIKDD